MNKGARMEDAGSVPFLWVPNGDLLIQLAAHFSEFFSFLFF